jgi:4-hydroxybenzoyl-CoA reductase subunit beta
MRLPRFHHHEPRSTDEALRLLEKHGEEALVMAGGTDLLVRMKLRLAAPVHLVSLSGIGSLAGMESHRGKGLSIGALTSVAVLSRSQALRKRCASLHGAACLVATEQIRHMGTLGGNLFQTTRCLYFNRTHEWRKALAPCFKRGGNVCHAVKGGKRCFSVYQGDLAPALIALECTAVLRSPGEEREVPVEDLFSGDGREPFRTSRETILTCVRIPRPDGAFSAYRKFRLRDGIDFPLAGVAVSMRKDGRRIARLRVCLTGVASSPVLVGKAEELARGERLTPSLIQEIGRVAARAARPVENAEGTPALRKSMIEHMTGEILGETAKP